MSYPNQPATLAATREPDLVKQILEVGAALAKPVRNPDEHGAHYVVLPDGWETYELPRLELPQHPIATVKLRDAASFIRYVNDHKADRSRIYATLEPARFLCVFDDFETSAVEDEVRGQADWRQFRAEFTVPASREWLTWTAANRKHMSQLAFAEFLQDQLPDVVEPSGADLLSLSLDFEASQSGQFVSSQRLQDGSHNLVWKADNSGGSVKLPEIIKLSFPVFENEQQRELQARLRYRVKDSLAIWYELIRPHKVLETAFRETMARVADETGLPLLLGTPE